jgi:hypothetical protein
MIDEGGARRRDLSQDIVRRADDQSRNASAFDHVGDETDGLMAKRSIGNEQSQVDPGLLQFLGERLRERVFNFFMAPHAAHEREVIGR